MYKAILLPVDLDAESSWRKAAPVARKLAETFDARLHVMTVLPDIRAGLVSQYFPPDFEHEAAEHAANALNGFCKAHLAGMALEEHIALGPIYRRIVETAKEQGCDLIVMASHRPEFADRLIGPNADHVMRSTDVSVMVVRE